MKKLLLLTCCCLSGYFLSAQVTINSSNYLHAAGYNEFRNIDVTGINAPAPGTNKTYDYTSLTGDSTVTIPYPAATDPMFSGATRLHYGSAIIGGISVKSEYYTELNSNGVFRLGSHVIPKSIGISALTGGANDTLTFPGSYSVFPTPMPDLKFPMTYGDNWTSTGTYNTDFIITVQGFGLDHTPGKEVQHVTAADSVMAWGVLRIPTANGGSIPYDGILVKSQRAYKDSFFLNGSEAPPALLGAFGVQQGQLNLYNTYSFYTPDHDGPILEIKMNDDWSQARESYYPDNDIVSGINEMAEQLHFNLYPNPLTTKEFNISLNKPSDAIWTATITNALGQSVKSIPVAGQGSLTIEADLDRGIKNGLYLLTVINENGQVVLSNKIVVNR